MEIIIKQNEQDDTKMTGEIGGGFALSGENFQMSLRGEVPTDALDWEFLLAMFTSGAIYAIANDFGFEQEELENIFLEDFFSLKSQIEENEK